MNPIYSLFVILLYPTVILLASAVQPYNQPLFISCGHTKSTSVASSSSPDIRGWKSDDDASFAPQNLNSISNTTSPNNADPPYDTARVFRTKLTYRFFLTPGPKFIRLHFVPSTAYNNIPPSQFYVSLEANHVIMLKNFSPSLNFPNKDQMYYEFYITVEEGSGKNLNLTFSPGDIGPNNINSISDSNSYGFINGIEIVPVPQGLYITDTPPKYLSNLGVGYSFSKLTVLQNVYRLNVGGDFVEPMDDTGNMWRAWFPDHNYLLPGGFPGQQGGLKYDSIQDIHINYTKSTPEYVAPPLVYSTERIMGKNPVQVNVKKNITWTFEVDRGFDYLMRLHFCEMETKITRSLQRQFDVYINNQMADGLDSIGSSGGLGVPFFRDYIIRVDEGNNATENSPKVPLSLALRPKLVHTAEVLLNGLEIFRLSELEGNSATNSLAVPNPPLPPSTPSRIPVVKGSNSHPHSLLIIGGAIGGAILFSLAIVACLVLRKWGANKEDTTFASKSNATNTSSKYKWIPNIFHSTGSTASTTSSSLPSDLCRHFTLAQIKAATSNFDKNWIIGKGGFGEVYKGSILNIGNETIQVAVKRLNTKSQQGAREFQTEIEMLSRLRHVHLVPLIGYCEDGGEMILVYEYMSRGTLRDHLMYKTSERNDHRNPSLSWMQRLRICVGSARGLHHLHAGASKLIIHRDVKTTNILLDDKWTAKVSDFGLSKAGPISFGMGPTHISTAVKGSAGYLDPEYYRNQQLTEKSDVYSFGVVLFEVLCARAAVNPCLPKEQANLAMWAHSHYKNGTLNTIVDPNIAGQIAPECLRKFGEIADMCVRDRGSERPSMGDVVWGLEFALQLQETAEKSNGLSGDSVGEGFVPASNSHVDVGEDGNTDNEMFSNSWDNFSRSSNGGVARNRSAMDSRTTTSSSSEYRFNMQSNSVFSEIIDPTAR